MINNILGFVLPGVTEFLVMIILGMAAIALPICLFIWLIKSMLRANKERQRLRMEVTKIADELEKIRKQGDN